MLFQAVLGFAFRPADFTYCCLFSPIYYAFPHLKNEVHHAMPLRHIPTESALILEELQILIFCNLDCSKILNADTMKEDMRQHMDLDRQRLHAMIQCIDA